MIISRQGCGGRGAGFKRGLALRAKWFSSQEEREKLARQGSWQIRLQRDLVEKGEPNSPSSSDTVRVSGEWEFPPARAGAPGRKAYHMTLIVGGRTSPKAFKRGFKPRVVWFKPL